MSAPSGSPPPPPQPSSSSSSSSNCLGIPDNPFGRPRMMLNMDLIESSSDSDEVETIESLSDFGAGDSQTGAEEELSSCSEVYTDNEDDDSGQGSGTDSEAAVEAGPHEEEAAEEEEEDEYDRIFNRGVSGSSSNESSSADENEDSDKFRTINGDPIEDHPTDSPSSSNKASTGPMIGRCVVKRRSNEDNQGPLGDNEHQPKSRRL